MENIKLSLVIPVYNEELGISETLKKISDFLGKKNYKWEILIVDDGSSDSTEAKVRRLKIHNIRFKKLSKNLGKGAAIRKGVRVARGEFVVFTDADLSVPIQFTDKLIDRLESGYEVVVGSRRIRGSKILRHQSFLRENMGRMFTFLSRIVTGVRISDFTCGFKGFRRTAAKKIFSRSLINRWVFDSEIIFLASKFKYKISEIPVKWMNREDSRVKSLGGVGYESLLELAKIRFNNFAGKYD